MAWTTPGTATAGDVLTAAFWNTQVRDNMIELAPFSAAYTSYTPTLTNTTAPITFAKYVKVGRFVSFGVLLTLTGAQVTGLIGISLPVTAATAGNGHFTSILDDVGVIAYLGTPFMGSTTRVDVYATLASGTYAGLTATSSTIPHTWAASDRIFLSGTYEAAS